MDIVSRSIAELTKFWNNASIAGRVSVVGSVLLLLVTVVGAGIWSSMPDFKPLRDGISPQLTGRIKSVLDAQGFQIA